MTAERHTGSLKFFSEDKHFGFIVREGGDGQKDDFVHASAFSKAGIALDEIKKGMRLSYVMAQQKGRSAASDLQKIV